MYSHEELGEIFKPDPDLTGERKRKDVSFQGAAWMLAGSMCEACPEGPELDAAVEYLVAAVASANASLS